MYKYVHFKFFLSLKGFFVQTGKNFNVINNLSVNLPNNEFIFRLNMWILIMKDYLNNDYIKQTYNSIPNDLISEEICSIDLKHVNKKE